MSAETATETTATAAAEAAPEETGALVRDGLLDQLIAFVGDWFDSLSQQLAEIGSGLTNIGRAGEFLRLVFADGQMRADTLHMLGLLALLLTGAAFAEWVARRLLRKPRRLLAHHAQLQQQRLQQQQADEETALAAAVAAANMDAATATASNVDVVAHAAATQDGAATTTPTEDAAAMATANADAAASSATASLAADANLPITDEPVSVARVRAGMETPDQTSASLEPRLHTVLAERRKTLVHSGLLQRMPFAIADALLVLLPLAVFLGAVTVLTFLLAPRNAAVAIYSAPIVEAYAGVRVGLAAMRLLISPASAGLRVLQVSDAMARYLFKWAIAAFVTVAAGLALAWLFALAGAGREIGTLCIKLASLIVHIMLITVVIQTRHPMQAYLRGDHTDASGSGRSSLRAFVAEIWPATAVFLIAAFWVVWALSVTDGFQRALRFGITTASVLIMARLVWILIIGLLDRSFEKSQSPAGGLANPELHRYHSLLRTLISCFIYALTVVALLEAWGVNALEWFESGTVGRRLLSAAATIAIATIVALVIWEVVSASLKRRILNWTEQGEVVRAARLRTLVPMIRTLLLAVIVLIVLMTALNELGVNVAPMLAGASIIGVALGFGSQKLVQDFITGIFLLMENAMQVGDTVTVAGLTGVVEYLSIRTVHLRAGDGSLHVVPFSSVSTVTNVNRGLGNAAVRVGVGADANLDEVYATLRTISDDMRTDARFGPLMLGDIDIWGVDQVDASMVTVAGQIRTTDRGRWPVQREFNKRMLLRFREIGIPLANPRETVLNTGGVAPVVVTGAGAEST